MSDLFAPYRDQLYTELVTKQDSRLRRLLATGVDMHRISYVRNANCDECHGTGMTVETHPRGDNYEVVLTECRTCPGLCVDGKSVHGRPSGDAPR